MTHDTPRRWRQAGLLALTACLVGQQGDAHGLTLLDEPTCADYVMNFDGNLADTQNRKWLLGFLSGMAAHSRRDAFKGIPPYTIYHQVYIYCKEYDDVPLSESAEAYFYRITRDIGG